MLATAHVTRCDTHDTHSDTPDSTSTANATDAILDACSCLLARWDRFFGDVRCTNPLDFVRTRDVEAVRQAMEMVRVAREIQGV